MLLQCVCEYTEYTNYSEYNAVFCIVPNDYIVHVSDCMTMSHYNSHTQTHILNCTTASLVVHGWSGTV